MVGLGLLISQTDWYQLSRWLLKSAGGRFKFLTWIWNFGIQQWYIGWYTIPWIVDWYISNECYLQYNSNVLQNVFDILIWLINSMVVAYIKTNKHCIDGFCNYESYVCLQLLELFGLWKNLLIILNDIKNAFSKSFHILKISWRIVLNCMLSGNRLWCFILFIFFYHYFKSKDSFMEQIGIISSHCFQWRKFQFIWPRMFSPGYMLYINEKRECDQPCKHACF